MERIDAYLRIDAPDNTRALADVDPAVLTRAARARSPIQEARMGKRWCGTLWPTPALAQEAGMSDDDYAAFVTGALFLDRPDPVAAWRELSDRQAKLVERLSEAREIRIEADGTDLRLRVEGRTWINSDGRRNMPSGEVFTGPHEDSANGTIRFTIPSSPRGVLVEDVTVTFENGKVVSATAARGQDYLDAALATDPGARFLGELGIGTNAGIDRATGSILLDEKMAGTVHLALGRSYPETGGRQRLSPALGSDLRSPRRRPIDRRRRSDPHLTTRQRAERPRAVASGTDMRRTKIVATIGPASQDLETLTRMAEAGMDVARLNFSHGNREIHAENAEMVRRAAVGGG